MNPARTGLESFYIGSLVMCRYNVMHILGTVLTIGGRSGPIPCIGCDFGAIAANVPTPILLNASISAVERSHDRFEG